MAGTTTTNTATRTSQTEYNNQPTVSAANVYTKLAEVELTQTATTPVNVGDSSKYVVKVTNYGPDTATNIIIRDIPPSKLNNIIVTPSVGTYSNGIWTIPSLANGQFATLTITGNAGVLMAGTNTPNTATKTSQTEYDPTTPDEHTTANIYTNEADLNITNTGTTPVNVGDTGTFTITVYNNGPDTATNIKINDILPTGFTARTPME